MPKIRHAYAQTAAHTTPHGTTPETQKLSTLVRPIEREADKQAARWARLAILTP